MTEHRPHPTGEEDPVGEETLELFADTGLFNRWMFETLEPWCKDNLLEIGSGIGNISAYLLSRFRQVTLSDLREHYCARLRSRFTGNASLEDVYSVDLSEPALDVSHPSLVNRFDTIFASNVVEHIENDLLALENCRRMLRPGGRLVVLVPAYSFLYNRFDRELGHFRRYRRKPLEQLFRSAGLTVMHSQYFNAVGTLGWWLSGSLPKKKTIPKIQLSLYNKLVPLFRVADGLLLHRIGLSVICVGEKK